MHNYSEYAEWKKFTLGNHYFFKYRLYNINLHLLEQRDTVTQLFFDSSSLKT